MTGEVEPAVWMLFEIRGNHFFLAIAIKVHGRPKDRCGIAFKPFMDAGNGFRIGRFVFLVKGDQGRPEIGLPIRLGLAASKSKNSWIRPAVGLFAYSDSKMDVRIIRSGTKRRNVPPIVRKEAVFAAAFTHAVRAGAHKGRTGNLKVFLDDLFLADLFLC